MPIDIFDEVETPVVAPPVIGATATTEGKWKWPLIILAGVLVFFLMFRGCGIGGGGIVGLDGTYVMLVEDVEKRPDLTSDQRGIFTSIEIREWCEANLGEDHYRNFDVDDNLENEPDHWKTLRGLLNVPPPAIMIASPRGSFQAPLEGGKDDVLKTLSKFSRR